MRLVFDRSCSLGWRSRLISFLKATSARMSYHSFKTRASVVGSWRNLARLSRASLSRPLETSHRGENGRKVMPAPRIKPGMVWRRNGSRQDHSPEIYCVPYVIQNAITIPDTMLNSSRTRRAPRISGGEISDMYSGATMDNLRHLAYFPTIFFAINDEEAPYIPIPIPPINRATVSME